MNDRRGSRRPLRALLSNPRIQKLLRSFGKQPQIDSCLRSRWIFFFDAKKRVVESEIRRVDGGISRRKVGLRTRKEDKRGKGNWRNWRNWKRERGIGCGIGRKRRENAEEKQNSADGRQEKPSQNPRQTQLRTFLR